MCWYYSDIYPVILYIDVKVWEIYSIFTFAEVTRKIPLLKKSEKATV